MSNVSELVVNGVHLEKVFSMDPQVVSLHSIEEAYSGDFRLYRARGTSLGAIALNVVNGNNYINPAWYPVMRWRNGMHAGDALSADIFAHGLLSPHNLQFRPSQKRELRNLLPRERRADMPPVFSSIILGIPRYHDSLRPAESPGYWLYKGKIGFHEIDPESRAYLEDLFGISFAKHFGRAWRNPTTPKDLDAVRYDQAMKDARRTLGIKE